MVKKENKVGHTRHASSTRQISVAFKLEDCNKLQNVCEERGLAIASYVRSAVLLRLKQEAVSD